MVEQLALHREPLLFTTLKALCRSPLRGGHRLFAIAERIGLLHGVLRYLIDERHPVYVPITRRWDLRDIRTYESELVSTIASKAHSFPGNITLIDCGADVGLLSALLLSKIEYITRVVAFEPNEEAYLLLHRTLTEQPCQSTVLRMGVSNLPGYGELRSPRYDPDDTGRYLVPVEHGGFRVTTIDNALTERPAYCILKIDVEGGELPVVEGAKTCIEAAEGMIIAIEAHPKVAARTGIDPCRILQFLLALRPFEFTVAERPEQQLDLARPFFEQVEADIVYNIVCTSVA
jgi:FkbM family methyltransferase